MLNLNVNADAPLLVVMGQSNAHGHGTKLPEAERILTPLKNVYGLACTQNQAYGLNDVVWSGFVTEGMNLGETQDHTYCLAESFARKWQAGIDRGAALPPLYVIQISIGAQGITMQERDGLTMWAPDRPPVIEKGPLGSVDISLYPLALEILSLAMKNLRAAGKNPRILGVHWNQWETEVDTGGDSVTYAERNYQQLFEGFVGSFGEAFPLWLYYPLARVYNNPEGVKAIQELFVKFKAENGLVSMMDPRKYPAFDERRDDQGIFQPDCVHYLPEVHRWFAEQQWSALFD